MKGPRLCVCFLAESAPPDLASTRRRPRRLAVRTNVVAKREYANPEIASSDNAVQMMALDRTGLAEVPSLGELLSCSDVFRSLGFEAPMRLSA